MTDIRKLYKMIVEMDQGSVEETIGLHDSFDLELNESFVIETGVVGFTRDGIIVEADEQTLEFLELNNVLLESEEPKPLRENKALAALVTAAGKAAMPAVKSAMKAAGPVVKDTLKTAAASFGGQAANRLADKFLGPQGAQEDEMVKENPLALAPLAGAVGRGAAMGAGSIAAGAIADKIGLGEKDELEEIKRLAMGKDVSEAFGHDEDEDSHDSSEAVYSAILNRILHQHRDVLSKFGPQKVMDAAREVSYDLNDLEEIGSSDISIWTKQVIDMLGPDEPDYLTQKNHSERYGDMNEEWDDEEGYDTNDPKHSKWAERQAELSDYERERARDERMDEAEYQGRKVPLGKPMQGDVKKSKVYVKKPDGKVVKVNFGDKNMTIKKSNPARRKSFRARHNCDNPGPRWKARYWSCRAW